MWNIARLTPILLALNFRSEIFWGRRGRPVQNVFHMEHSPEKAASGPMFHMEQYRDFH